MDRSLPDVPVLRPKFDVVHRAPNQKLIEWLAGMQERAATGELQGAVCVCEWNDGAVSDGWCLTGVQNYRVLGGLSVVLHKLAAMLLN